MSLKLLFIILLASACLGHLNNTCSTVSLSWPHSHMYVSAISYVHAVRRHPETVLNTDGIITAICVTLMYTADSRRQITLLRKARSTCHNAVKHNGQLVKRFYGVRSWLCDELTASRPPYGGRTIIMVALWNRADHYIFMLFLLLLSSFFFFFLA